MMREPTAVEPVKEILRTSGCLHKRVAHLLARTGQDLQSARRQTRFGGQFAQPQGGQRGMAGGLQDHAISRRQRRRHFPGRDGKGKIPRHNRRHHAHRLAQGEIESAAATREWSGRKIL